MNIELKKWSKNYKNDLIRMCNSVDRQYLSDRIPDPYTEDDANWWLSMVEEKDGQDGIFRGISLDGKIIGNISIEKKSDVYRIDAELGYFLEAEYSSKGIMTEAARLICEIGFKELDIMRITGLVYEPNLASRKVLEKNNFKLEGVWKNGALKNGEIFSVYHYGKLK